MTRKEYLKRCKDDCAEFMASHPRTWIKYVYRDRQARAELGAARSYLRRADAVMSGSSEPDAVRCGRDVLETILSRAWSRLQPVGVLVVADIDGKLHIGASLCDKHDHWNRHIGLSKAMHAIISCHTSNWMSTPVVKIGSDEFAYRESLVDRIPDSMINHAVELLLSISYRLSKVT